MLADTPRVSFTAMRDGTAQDYQLLDRLERDYIAALPDRLLRALSALDDTLSGYRVSRLEHSLQSATRALRAHESKQMVVACLLHDLGDVLAPCAHGEYAAAVLRPYVDERIHWIIKHHGVFQMYYYAHHTGGDRHARERYREHRWYADAVHFVEHYDQNCFDPAYPTEPLATFEPLVREVFAKVRCDDFESAARYGQ